MWRTRRTKQCAITKGPGCSNQRQCNDADDRHDAQAPPRDRHILVVFVVGLLVEVLVIGFLNAVDVLTVLDLFNLLLIISLTRRIAARVLVGLIATLVR